MAYLSSRIRPSFGCCRILDWLIPSSIFLPALTPDKSDKLYRSHLLLNDRLSDGQPVSADSRVDLSKWKKVPPKEQVIDLVEAILRRLIWLREHDAFLTYFVASRPDML